MTNLFWIIYFAIGTVYAWHNGSTPRAQTLDRNKLVNETIGAVLFGAPVLVFGFAIGLVVGLWRSLTKAKTKVKSPTVSANDETRH